jgi:hypothetical protein
VAVGWWLIFRQLIFRQSDDGVAAMFIINESGGVLASVLVFAFGMGCWLVAEYFFFTYKVFFLCGMWNFLNCHITACGLGSVLARALFF